MIAKLFKGLWHALNFSRRLLVNLVFVVLIIGLVVAMMTSEEEILVPQDSVLRLNLSGKLVEQLTYVDPIDAALDDTFGSKEKPMEILVDDVIKVINNAARDNRIKAIHLDLRNLYHGHLDKLRDITTAIEAFKASGKPVYAHGPYFTQTQYYLASTANEVSMHPYGGVSIKGFGTYPMYFKDALEKLQVTQHIFRVGTYKSAVEPFIRNDMSDAAKEANKLWLSSLWEQYKEDVAARRPFDTDNFDETLTQLGEKMASVSGDSAQFAMKYGWVDALETDQEFNDKLVQLVGTQNKGNKYKQVKYSEYLASISGIQTIPNPLSDKVAVVVAKGHIVDGKRKAGVIGGDSTAALLRKARIDENVKAVVLRIDSGGGSVFASEQIRNEVLAIKAAGKPIVASMGSVAASGGYWIAASANEIWASPSTITGSIGIFGTIFTFENSLKELGVYSDGVATTELKSSSISRGIDPQYADIIQMGVEDAYDKFLSVISEARNLNKEDVNEVAQGRVWLAPQALEFGLIDKLGTKEQAIESAAALASLEHYDVITVEQTLTDKERLMQQIFGAKVTQSLLPKASQTDTLQKVSQQSIGNLIYKVQQSANMIELYNDPNSLYSVCTMCDVTQ
ncbi:signal peptide peptidase SppA [Pseudoalteromonas sp. Of7M-16]|uniref:signal peptide peptidase SppA n=1 Tax=Pseudoalteromonas sp. Of7M-16 TaxID=2917756 RepID=UPI001EF500C6|nr:signal peptide peptidase SppA [Pseudoalteromonas sp. Of7M-16]MCG7550809.1 signal peptide peptidase SppA [Pseudoalteromonas sp. Of7M-16]